MAGATTSAGWISKGYDTTFNGSNGYTDGFVVKLNSAGQLVWSTYLGGSDRDTASGIAIDSKDNVIATGKTNSSGWASSGLGTSPNSFNEDAFVVKFSSTGQLLWSTYLGGANDDSSQCIAVDSADNIIVGGNTFSSGWISGGYDTIYKYLDGFVVKLTPAGQHIWSTYVGGSGDEFGLGIAVDPWDNVILTGWTSSAGWISGGYDTSYNGGMKDAFLSKLSAAGAFLWSNYLGGTGSDEGVGVATDIMGNIFVAGYTLSDGWISGGFNTNLIGSNDAFVAKFTPEGMPCWSTYLGGSLGETAKGVAVDGAHNVYVTGDTGSSGWVSGGYNTSFNDGVYVYGFLSKIHDYNFSATNGSLNVTINPTMAVTAGGAMAAYWYDGLAQQRNHGNSGSYR